MWYFFTKTAPSAGDDLLVGESEVNEANRNRVLKGIVCTGGTAAGDSVVKIYAGAELLAQVENNTTGDTIADMSASLTPVGSGPIPAGKKLTAILEVDGGNNISLGLSILP